MSDVWSRGIRAGVIGSPDHAGGLGKAAVYSRDLTRAAIFEAIRDRRTYATTGARILLDVRVAGHFMGTEARRPPGDAVPISIRVQAPSPIERVQIIRNERVVQVVTSNARALQLTWSDVTPPEGETLYYRVRVILKDRQLALSSPVLLTPRGRGEALAAGD